MNFQFLDVHAIDGNDIFRSVRFFSTLYYFVVTLLCHKVDEYRFTMDPQSKLNKEELMIRLKTDSTNAGNCNRTSHSPFTDSLSLDMFTEVYWKRTTTLVGGLLKNPAFDLISLYNIDPQNIKIMIKPGKKGVNKS